MDINRLQTERTLLNIRDELNRLSVFQDQMIFDLNQGILLNQQYMN